MDGDQGALNKFEHGEWSAGFHDLKVSLDKLLGRAENDAQTLFTLGLKTLTNDLKTPLGQAAATAIGTALADGVAGKTVAQIGADVLPSLESSVVADAKAAGQDAENVVLNTARVMLLGSQAQAAAPPTPSAASTGAAGSGGAEPPPAAV
jgi:hypothetical protein